MKKQKGRLGWGGLLLLSTECPHVRSKAEAGFGRSVAEQRLVTIGPMQALKKRATGKPPKRHSFRFDAGNSFISDTASLALIGRAYGLRNRLK